MSSFDRFVGDISTWYWWVSVVVVGLLVNLTSAYLKIPLDRWLERRSSAAARRRRQNEASFQGELDLMVRSSAYLASTGFIEIRHRLMSFVLAAFAFAFLRGASQPSAKVQALGDLTVWVQVGLLALALLSLASALWAHKIAARATTLMFAARRRLREQIDSGSSKEGDA